MNDIKKYLTVRSLIGDVKVPMKDLHDAPLDGAEYYQKIMPSSVREKIIEKANAKNQSELVTICELLCDKIEME